MAEKASDEEFAAGWNRAHEDRVVAKLVDKLEDLAEGTIDGGTIKLTYTEASAILAMLRDPKYFAEIEKIREALNVGDDCSTCPDMDEFLERCKKCGYHKEECECG